jgi:hypothetical protein
MGQVSLENTRINMTVRLAKCPPAVLHSYPDLHKQANWPHDIGAHQFNSGLR